MLTANSTTPASLMPQPYRIVGRVEEIPGCVTLEVMPSAQSQCPAFTPGQFYMLYVFGHGEVPISISSDPTDTTTLSFTIMGVGATSGALCRLPVDATLGLRGPYGHGWPLNELAGRDIVLMAGGLGLAPLRPLLYRLLHARERYGAVTLLYGSRQPESLLFREQLTAWQQTGCIGVDMTVDAAQRNWPGKVGVVTDCLRDHHLQPSRTTALICGPEIMMRFSAYALLDRGVAATDIYISMERNMHCAVKQCGHCQYGPWFVCADGPVFRFDQVAPWFNLREI